MYLASAVAQCRSSLASGMAGFRGSEWAISVLFLSIAQLCSQHLQECFAHDRGSITIIWNKGEMNDWCLNGGTILLDPECSSMCTPGSHKQSELDSRWGLFTLWLQRNPLHRLCRAYVCWKGIVNTSTVVDLLQRWLSIGPPGSLCTLLLPLRNRIFFPLLEPGLVCDGL